MNKGFVQPAPGLLVRREDAAGYIADEGEDVVLTTYYRRRLRDGDLVRAEPPAPDDLLDAISLISDRPDAFTQDGRPKVEDLAAVLGREITAAERDRAWAAHQHTGD